MQWSQGTLCGTHACKFLSSKVSQKLDNQHARVALTPVANESEHNQVFFHYTDLGPTPPEINEIFSYYF